MKNIVLLLLLPAIALAQPTKPPAKKGQIEAEEIVIEKSRAITLPEADRSFEKITVAARKPDVATRPSEYTARDLRLPDLNPRFRILQMAPETTPAPTGNLIKLGLGSYTALYAEVFAGAARSEAFSWNVRARNTTFGTGPVQKRNSGTQENFLAGHVKLFTTPLTATAGLELSRERYYFYGTQARRDRDDIRQVFSSAALKTSFTSNATDSPLDYRLDFNLRNLADAYNAREFELGVHLDSKYRISDALRVLVPSDTYFSRLQDSGSVARNLFRVKPQVEFSGEAFRITAGLNVVTQNDTAPALSKLNLYPVAEAQVTIGGAVTVFGGIGGDVQRNTLRQWVDENPFVNNRLQVLNTARSSEIYGGLRRQLGGALSFNVRTSLAQYKNMAFFVNSPRDSARFDLLYHPDLTRVLNVSTEIAYDAGKRFRIAGKADFYRYTLRKPAAELSQPWHRPTFTASVLGRFAATESLFFNTEIYYLGGIQARAPAGGRAVSLDPVADINLKGEYLFLDKFSAYLSLNNLLAAQYQRFLNYPHRGITLMLGATYGF